MAIAKSTDISINGIGGAIISICAALGIIASIIQIMTGMTIINIIASSIVIIAFTTIWIRIARESRIQLEPE